MSESYGGNMFARFKALFSKRKKPAKKQPKVLRYEELEPRVLFAADILPGLDGVAVEEQVLAADTGITDQLMQAADAVSVEQAAAAERRELVIVNPNLPDYSQLTADLQGSDNGRTFDVMVLEADQDGIEQVSEILAARSDLAAVHFITHGADGQIQLGNSWLNANSLQQNRESVAGWGSALTGEGDFLFYGCNVAADSPGQSLLNEIAWLSGADVAASDDLTGKSQFGADWDLEYDHGIVETGLAVNGDAQQNWNGVLANNPPTVALSNTTTSISEAADTSNRTRVADITVTDDAPGTNVLSLSGTDAGLFEIESGVLYLKAGANLDFETNGQLDVTVEINDASLVPDPNDTAALSITVSDANDPPTVAPSNTTTSISEAADTTTRTQVADITVTDDALGTEVLSLAGADAGLFEIDAGVLYLKAGAVLDTETNAQLDVIVQVNDATLSPNPNDTAVLSITVTDANDPPTVSLSNTMVSIGEGADTSTRTKVADITVTDDGQGTNGLSLSGTDAGLFEIDAGVLYLKAGAALDFETNAQLDVTVQVNDATLAPDPNHTTALSITVTDANDPPTVALSNTTTSISEAADTTNRTQVADITVTDDTLGANALSLAGADAGLFEIESGVLYLKAGAALDYETNAQLDVTVQVNDATLGPDPNHTAALSITVTDGNDPPVITSDGGSATAALNAAENQTGVTTVSASDSNGDTPTYSITGGADAALFDIDPGTGVLTFKAAPDFEVAVDADANGVYEVQVTAADGSGGTDVQTLSVTVTDDGELPTAGIDGGPYTINEGDPVTLDASPSADPDGDALTYAWDLDNDGQFDDASGRSPTLTWDQLQSLGITDDGVYDVSVEVDDAADGTDTASTTLTVVNTAPTLTTHGERWADDGGLYTLNLSPSDPGDDTITGWTINWGDGTIETINGNPASVTHTYTGVGRTYSILAAATDGDGTYLQNELLVPSYEYGDSIFRYAATTGAFLQEFAMADGLNNPVQAIIGPDGSIYVTGEASDNVLRYNAATGAFIDKFVSDGDGGLNGARGMVFGADGNLYVSSLWTDEVLRYDGTTGDFIDAFVTAASGGLSQPYGLAIGPDGNLYVNSYNDSQVLRYNGTTGAFIDVFVSSGSGGLNTPENMIFGPDGNLYIASFNTNEVLRYNGTTGAFIDAFITAGLGGLSDPSGLAFGPDGNLYVTDYRDAAVLRYDRTTGGFIDEYVSAKSGGLVSPTLLTFLPQQQVTVTRAPVIGGTSAGQPVDDTATVLPFAAVTVSDGDPGDTVTVTVSLSDGDDNGTFSAASLAASGFTKTGSGEYSLSAGTPAAAQSAIRQLVFDPTENQVAAGSTVTTTFTIEVNDGNIAATDTTTTVIATSINAAPTVSGSYIMTSTDKVTAGAAVQVSAILADAAIRIDDSDGDTLGMAVVGKTGLGTWQYFLDGAGGWTDLGPVSADAAVLLSETTWLRYVPDGINVENAGLDFCAWDQTFGAASTTGSPSVGDTTPGGGTAAYSAGTGAVALTVTEVNDGPTVALSNTTTSISEGADTTTRIQVADITVTDDAPGTNVLSLTGADAGLFEIESGVLYLKAGTVLDYETNAQLDVTVQVNDTTVAPNPNDTAALSISVSDANEAPTVALSNTTTSISEGADTTSRTQVADITVTDDALGTEVLSLSGADAGLFEINAGVLYLKAGAVLDFETNAQLDVTVQVNDATLAPDPNGTTDLSITVTDFNDPPTLTLSNTMVSISEGADTTSRIQVADITVTDDALGANVLSLSGADAGLFEIDSGELYLKAGTVLDFETNAQLDVIVQVNDATLAPDPNDTAALNITVTDANDPPTLTLSNTMVSISEGADTTNRTQVADITVTDDALGTNVLSLSGTDAGLFEIDSGVLYLQAGVVLDQATNPQLDVTVQVNDATLLPDPNHSANLSITVNEVTGTNNPPTVALSNTTTSISEAADTTNRTRVADITVTDDAMGTNVLSLSGTDAGLFEIASGVLYLKAGANLDHETNGQLDVTVQVNDAGLLPDPNDAAALSITVGDANDAPTVALSNTTISISETADTTTRTKVADITVTDDTLGTNLLSLSGADAGLFEIDSGVLYLKAGATLDYATNAQLDVTVQVNDATLFPDPNDTAALSISVNEANNPPTINAMAGYEVDEDSGYSLLQGISIADVDAGNADVRVTLDVANGVLQLGNTAGLTTISGNSSASVELEGSVADLNAALASLSYRPDPDFWGSDDPLVTVDDLGNTGPGGPQVANKRLSLVVNPVNDPGTVTIDNLTPTQGDTLTAGVADVDGAGGSIAYQWYRDGVPIEGATAADHFTTQADVDKVITVTADYTDDLAGVESPTSAGTAPVTNVNDAPMLGNNRLSISQGATVTLDGSMLSAADVDHPDASVVFNVSDITAGHFALAGDPSTPITSFDQSEISAGNVVFVHDGSDAQPGYSVSVSDGADSTAAVPADITFLPSNGNNLTLTESNAMPPKKAEAEPGLSVKSAEPDSSAGDMPLSGGAVTPITSATQNVIDDGIVVFIQDENNTPASVGSDFGRDDSGRNEDKPRSPAAYFSYQKLKLMLSASNNKELSDALGNFEISALSASDYNLVRNSLDAIKEEINAEIMLGRTVLGSAIAASIGLSAGYVVWLLKGGSLLASVLSSLPAWQLADPLAILSNRQGEGFIDDDESLETIIDDGTKRVDAKKKRQPEVEQHQRRID